MATSASVSLEPPEVTVSVDDVFVPSVVVEPIVVTTGVPFCVEGPTVAVEVLVVVEVVEGWLLAIAELADGLVRHTLPAAACDEITQGLVLVLEVGAGVLAWCTVTGVPSVVVVGVVELLLVTAPPVVVSLTETPFTTLTIRVIGVVSVFVVVKVAVFVWVVTSLSLRVVTRSVSRTWTTCRCTDVPLPQFTPPGRKL
jgi:hypothetical protein